MAADTKQKPFRDLLKHHRDIFVDPLLWTYRHLDLVGCRFEDVDTASTASIQDDCKADNDQRPYPKLTSDAEQLATHPFPVAKHYRLASILMGKDRAFAKTRKGPPFFFTGQPVHRPHYTVFYRGKLDEHIRNSPYPLVGYLHYTDVNGDRRSKFEPCPAPNGGQNWIGGNILHKRLAQIKPKEWTHDPYYVCVLLALAQFQERKIGSLRPVVYTSRLLVTNICDKEFIHFYEAEISAELLEVLRSPKTATEYKKWPTIWRRKIPFKPYHTFADRIMAELVAPRPLCFPEPSTQSDDLNDANLNMEPSIRSDPNGTKRPCEQESNKEYKMKRIT